MSCANDSDDSSSNILNDQKMENWKLESDQMKEEEELNREKLL